MKLISYYSLFALFAIISNFLMQELSLYLYDGVFALLISVFIGTLLGLVVKFYLDKHYIFKYMVKSQGHNLQLFIVYSFMGGVTTVIFWAFELGFYIFFDSHTMKYVGGFIGLVIGYIIKYYLDKKFVFIN